MSVILGRGKMTLAGNVGGKRDRKDAARSKFVKKPIPVRIKRGPTVRLVPIRDEKEKVRLVLARERERESTACVCKN